MYDKVGEMPKCDNIKARQGKAVFLNRRAAAQYRALASIISGRERFSWN